METLTPLQISKLNKTVSRMGKYRPNEHSFNKGICCDAYTVLYGDIEFLKHYMDPEIKPDQTEQDFNDERQYNLDSLANFIGLLIIKKDNEGLKLLLERMDVCKYHKYLIYGGQPQEYSRTFLTHLPRYDETSFYNSTSFNQTNILNFCFIKNNLEAYQMLLDDGVNHNCLTKNHYFYRPYIKLTELTVFSKMIIRIFFIFLGLESDWCGGVFDDSWRQYTTPQLKSRLKEFIVRALIKDNPSLFKSNLETIGFPTTKMLIDPETALLKDIDEFLFGASDHIGLQFGNSFDMRESFDDDTLDDVILNIKLIVDSCLLEVENYNLMAVRQRISLAQSLRDRDLTNLAESHLDEDTRSKVLAAFTEMQPEISLARSYNPREPYEPINSSDLDGGKGKKTKKKKYKTKKKIRRNINKRRNINTRRNIKTRKGNIF